MRILAVMLMVFCSLSPALADTTGNIEGYVRDYNTSAPLADATVSAESPVGNYEVHTDSSGHYIFFSLHPGIYRLSATKRFHELRTKVMCVISGSTRKADFSIARGLVDRVKIQAPMWRSTEPAPGITEDLYSIGDC